MKDSFCQLWLTAGSKQEANKIAQALLDKRLVACARQIPAKSDYRWQGKIEQADEILLMMESRIDLFEEIEAEVSKLHSYEAFVLYAVPINQMSKKAQRWLADELNSNE